MIRSVKDKRSMTRQNKKLFKLRGELITVIMLGLLSFYSCNGQTPDCPPIYLESPELEARIKGYEDEVTSLTTEKNKALDSVATLNTLTRQLQKLLDTDAQTIQVLNADKLRLTQDLNKANSDIAKVKLDLGIARDSISDLLNQDAIVVRDTVTVESEYITVNGKEYKVADIENILPNQTTDTITLGFCLDDTSKREFLHEGPIDQYPHFVNFASKNRGLVKVWFKTPLTDEIKVQDTITVQRIRSHKEGLTELIFIK